MSDWTQVRALIIEHDETGTPWPECPDCHAPLLAYYMGDGSLDHVMCERGCGYFVGALDDESEDQ